MTELADVLWHDVAEACFEHDASAERRLCAEMARLVPEQRGEQDCAD